MIKVLVSIFLIIGSLATANEPPKECAFVLSDLTGLDLFKTANEYQGSSEIKFKGFVGTTPLLDPQSPDKGGILVYVSKEAEISKLPTFFRGVKLNYKIVSQENKAVFERNREQLKEQLLLPASTTLTPLKMDSYHTLLGEIYKTLQREEIPFSGALIEELPNGLIGIGIHLKWDADIVELMDFITETLNPFVGKVPMVVMTSDQGWYFEI